jgi:hypothetical protein
LPPSVGVSSVTTKPTLFSVDPDITRVSVIVVVVAVAVAVAVAADVAVDVAVAVADVVGIVVAEADDGLGVGATVTATITVVGVGAGVGAIVGAQVREKQVQSFWREAGHEKQLRSSDPNRETTHIRTDGGAVDDGSDVN